MTDRFLLSDKWTISHSAPGRFDQEPEVKERPVSGIRNIKPVLARGIGGRTFFGSIIFS